jgi:hypothetical protein
LIYVTVRITQTISTITNATANGKYYMTNNKITEETQARREVVTQLYSDSNKAFTIAIMAAGLLLIALRHNASISGMVTWSLIFFTTYGLRFAIGSKFQREAFTIDSASKWLNRFRLTTLLCGLAWGSVGYFISPKDNGELQVLHYRRTVITFFRRWHWRTHEHSLLNKQ